MHFGHPEAVVKAAPDGYTLLVVDAAPAINATLYRNLNFVFLPDIAPVACVISTPLFMEVNPPRNGTAKTHTK